jgi:hypothetical protein
MSLQNADHNSTDDERQESMTQGNLARHNRQMAPPTISSVQLNIVTSIDVAGATYTGHLDGKAGLMDNSAKSGQGNQFPQDRVQTGPDSELVDLCQRHAAEAGQ